MRPSWKASVLPDLHFSSIGVLVKKHCPLELVHNFINSIPLIHFATSIYLLNVIIMLSSEGRQPWKDNVLSIAAFKPSMATSCTTSHWCYIDFMEMMQRKAEFKITRVFFKWKLIKNTSYSKESMLIISWLRLVWLLVALEGLLSLGLGGTAVCPWPLTESVLSQPRGGLQRDKLQFIQEV